MLQHEMHVCLNYGNMGLLFARESSLEPSIRMECWFIDYTSCLKSFTESDNILLYTCDGQTQLFSSFIVMYSQPYSSLMNFDAVGFQGWLCMTLNSRFTGFSPRL